MMFRSAVLYVLMCHILLSFWVVVVIYVRKLWVKLYVSYGISCLVVFVFSSSSCSFSRYVALTVCMDLFVSTASVEQLGLCILKILKKCINVKMVKISWLMYTYGGFKGSVYTTTFSNNKGKLFMCLEIYLQYMKTAFGAWKRRILKTGFKVQGFENITVIVSV